MKKLLLSIYLVGAYSIKTSNSCTGCWTGTSGPCIAADTVCHDYLQGECPPGTTLCDTTLYSCQTDYTCVESDSGTYESMNSCQSDCTAPVPKYACDSSSYTCAESDSGSYETMSACSSSCVEGAKFACDSSTYTCSESASGTFDSLSACQSGCKQKDASRDFTKWMTTVPTDAWGASGFQRLVKEINPTVSASLAATWAAEITDAAKRFPTFCNSGDDDKDMMEFAAFISIIGAETSFNPANGFPCTKEIGCPNCQVCSYNSEGKLCTTNDTLQYFGRGPLQLSWNFNYYAYSEFMYNDGYVLVNNPSKVTESDTSCWSSAMWFWMVTHEYGGWCQPPATWPTFDSCNSTCYSGPTGCGTSGCSNDHWLPRQYDSCHNAISGTNGTGFGEVMAVINGGYTCCEITNYPQQSTGKMTKYLKIYNLWSGKDAVPDLSNISMPNCPQGDGMDCSSGTCKH